MAEAAVAEGIVPGDSAAYRRTASKTGSSVGTGTAGCIITTGGVCPDERKKSPNPRLWDGLARSEGLGLFGTTYLTTECAVKGYADRPSTGPTTRHRGNVGSIISHTNLTNH